MDYGTTAVVSSGRQRRWVKRATIRGADLLRDHMIRSIDSRIAGKTLATNGGLYSAQDHVTPAFTRNADFWAADLVAKLTCISPSNSDRDNIGAGVAITPRHVLYCKHGGEGVGYPSDTSTIRFVTAADVVVERTQDDHLELSLDFCIGLLDEDLPATITPCPIAPDNFLSKWGSFSPRVPFLVLDQQEKGLVHDVDSFDGIRLLRTVAPTDATRLLFYEVLVPGDSGDPAFAIIDGELVLLGVVKDPNVMMSVIGGNSVIAAGITTIGANGHAITNPSLNESDLLT